MIKPRVLVTGATGKTGSVVATELLQAGYPVRALVHREELALLMVAPFSPGFNLKRYDRELRAPFPSQPQFAPESPVWIREHAQAGFIRSTGSGAENHSALTERVPEKA